jgi:hypothetical protein
MVPGELNDRAADNWRPLLAIADQAGGSWPERARRAAQALSGVGSEEDAVGIMLLADLRDLFAQKATDRLLTESILPALHDMEERPWSEWRRGKPMSARHVAELLRPFDVRPRKIREGDRTLSGYRLSDLSDALGRYLPVLDPEHPEQINDDAKMRGISMPEQTPGVPDRRAGLSADENSDVPDVPDVEASWTG